MSMIQDGTGTSTLARVNSKNRLTTNAVTLSEDGMSALEGNAWLSMTDEIVLTSSDETAVMYFANNGVEDIFLERIFLNTGLTTGGTAGQGTTKFYNNPTTGTIIDNAVTIAPTNRNLGSSNDPSVLIYKGVEGDTVTNGIIAVTAIVPAQQLFAVIDLGFVVPPGSAFIQTYQPPAGNTSQIFHATLNFHQDGFDT